MKIAIPSVQVPFIRGGANLMTIGLKKAIEKYGYEVEIITIPFKFFPTDYLNKNIDYWLEQDFREFNGRVIDKVIALQFPSYYIKHPDKTLWLMHQHRMVYELFDNNNINIELENLKKKITSYDNKILKDYKKRFTISQNVADRLEKYNQIEAQPLYHPPYDERSFFCKEYDDYIFFPSRLEFLKRQSLFIEAMNLTKSPVKAVLSGGGSHYEDYKRKIEYLNISHKVLLTGEITQQEKFNFYASALAVAFIPFDEDYGYVTLEAMLSSKLIITCSDSGGVLEFVEDGQNGFIVEPSAKALAQRIDWIYYNRKRAIKMGELSKEIYKQKNISWEKVVSSLLDEK